MVIEANSTRAYSKGDIKIFGKTQMEAGKTFKK
jgi:hypothetical protein